MPRFMVMILDDEAEDRKLAPSETKALVEGHAAYEQKLRASGVYLDGDVCVPRPRDGASPSAMGRRGVEALGGYYVVEAGASRPRSRIAEECARCRRAARSTCGRS